MHLQQLVLIALQHLKKFYSTQYTLVAHLICGYS